MSEAPKKPVEETAGEIASLDDEELLGIVGGNEGNDNCTAGDDNFCGYSPSPDWPENE